MAYSKTILFKTGSVPGIPIHTGQHFEFGIPPNSVEHPQNILLFVESSTCTSSPITFSYLSISILTLFNPYLLFFPSYMQLLLYPFLQISYQQVAFQLVVPPYLIHKVDL